MEHFYDKPLKFLDVIKWLFILALIAVALLYYPMMYGIREARLSSVAGRFYKVLCAASRYVEEEPKSCFEKNAESGKSNYWKTNLDNGYGYPQHDKESNHFRENSYIFYPLPSEAELSDVLAVNTITPDQLQKLNKRVEEVTYFICVEAEELHVTPKQQSFFSGKEFIDFCNKAYEKNSGIGNSYVIEGHVGKKHERTYKVITLDEFVRKVKSECGLP